MEVSGNRATHTNFAQGLSQEQWQLNAVNPDERYRNEEQNKTILLFVRT